MLSSLKGQFVHLIAILAFIIASLAYFYPVLEGKKIFQSDIVQYTGMAKQQIDFREATGEETYWTNSAFGGMPTYQLGAKYPNNFIKKLDLSLRFLPRPADYLFLYFLSFYILLSVLKLDFRLALLGAFAFGFSTYLIIILGVGHNAKAHAIAYMPLVLAGVLLTFQKRYLWGFLLTTIGMGLELVANHFQMTYYLGLLVVILGIAYFIDAYKKKMLPHYFKSVGISIAAVIMAIGLNATNILATQEYVKESTRGKSELSIDADGMPKEASTGLDKDYITEYSYGKLESLNLLIPRFMGGGSYEDLGKESNTYDAFRNLGATPTQALQESKRAPTYWGDQPIVEAPAYVGAVILFLFVLALFLIKGRLKYWIVGGVLLALFLSFGKNMNWLTDLFIDFVPLYNKFRAVSSIQVIIELCVPILGIFGLSRILNAFEQEEDKIKALKFTTGIMGVLILGLLIFKGSFDFSSSRDAMYAQAYGMGFVDALRADREAIFTSDAIRSLILVLLSAALIFGYLKEKIKENVLLMAFGILILFDLIGVDKRYVNADDFVLASRVERPYEPNQADKEILKDTSHFRVFDITTANTRPSYFHNSINGYHAAKLRRYNELFDFHISKNNMAVLNMLNTKYIILAEENGGPMVYENPDALGNAWFISELKEVNTADDEIRALDSLITSFQAVVNVDQFEIQKSEFSIDSTASIKLVEYQPNKLVYESQNSSDGFAVFSENYYQPGWKSTLDGEEVEHIRANYVLRGMYIPKGTHKIEFVFDPPVIQKGKTISLVSSILTVLIFLGTLFFSLRKR